MKLLKLFTIIAAITLVFTVIAPSTSFAQGTYDCRWNGAIFPPCNVRSGRTLDCDSANGYSPDTSACTSISSRNTCNSTKNITCTGGEEPEANPDTDPDPDDDSSGSGGSIDPIQGTVLDSEEVLCDDGKGVYTNIGCIPITSTTSIATTVARMGAGIGGFIAIVLMGLASYQMATSQGDPRRLQGAKDLFFSAIAGLILLILAGFALSLFGVEILGLFG